jgi:hypothetical protein
MPLPEPQFEIQTYRDILDDAISRIPAHTPEWTNRAEPDPGITLLQLFSYMYEALQYRANLIPERNRQKFLRLLQIPVRPASPAEGLVAFSNPRGVFDVLTLNENQAVNAGNVAFKTERGLDILPIETRVYYKRALSGQAFTDADAVYRDLFAVLQEDDPATDLSYYETTLYEPAADGSSLRSIDVARDTVDGCLWLALLSRAQDDVDTAREKIAGSFLSLGLMPIVDDDGRVLEPESSAVDDSDTVLTFELPNAEDARIRYEPINARIEHDLLNSPGVVKFALPVKEKLTTWAEEPLTAGVDNRPPSLENTDDGPRLITWVRIRAPQVDTTLAPENRASSVRLAWLGVNATPVVQRIDVPGERLANGDGTPDQVRRLANAPVIDGSLTLTVNGVEWTPIDDLAAAEPELASLSSARVNDDGEDMRRVYRVDPESGEIFFGDGTHGERPLKGAIIQASYAFGGGPQGMVGIGTINKGPLLPPGIRVTNPVPTWGGTAGETTEDAERLIPQQIRHRNRLVSKDDFEDIVRRTPGVSIGRVDVLPLFRPGYGDQNLDGAVTVMVVPEDGQVPDHFFLSSVCDYLAPRRIVTMELHVRGPEFVPVWVSVGLDIVSGFDPAPVREEVKAKIETFLSPLQGGFPREGQVTGDGWPLRRAIDKLEIQAAVTRVDGVSKVNGLLLATAGESDTDIIELTGLQLPQLMKVGVTLGDPLPMDAVRGEIDADQDPRNRLTNVIPVPVIPDEC